ncbi:MAG: hypothetical protein GTO18_13520 [Anaerolineales bacterium]|nr:hypothetical protein [Anaerolineales bacterium]
MVTMTAKKSMKQISQQKDLHAKWERQSVRIIQTALAPLGVSPYDAVSIWIGLKSKPGIVLCSNQRADLDKIAVEVAQTTLDHDENRWISLQGHPWWAGQSPNQAQLIAMQQRLTSIRFRTFLVYASKQQENYQLHLALLHGIGQGELHNFFVEIPRQVKAFGGVLELPWDFSTTPTALPEYLYILGTFGQDLDIIDDNDVLDHCSIILLDEQFGDHWVPQQVPHINDHSTQTTLAICRNFNPYRAGNLFPMSHKKDAMRVLVDALLLFNKHRVKTNIGIITDAYLHLGHAWDAEGHGLFDLNKNRNIHIAGDYWLKQSLIPRIRRIVDHKPKLQKEGLQLLTENYPGAERLWRRLWPS